MHINKIVRLSLKTPQPHKKCKVYDRLSQQHLGFLFNVCTANLAPAEILKAQRHEINIQMMHLLKVRKKVRRRFVYSASCVQATSNALSRH